MVINLYGKNYDVTLRREKYYHNDAMAVRLEDTLSGEPFCVISVNLDSSPRLPPNVFRCKNWSENGPIIPQLEAMGFIRRRDDIPEEQSGYVMVPAYELLLSVP